jgi:hypothetical protein
MRHFVVKLRNFWFLAKRPALPDPSSARFARGRSYIGAWFTATEAIPGGASCGDTIPCDGIGNGNEGLPLRPPRENKPSTSGVGSRSTPFFSRTAHSVTDNCRESQASCYRGCHSRRDCCRPGYRHHGRHPRRRGRRRSIRRSPRYSGPRGLCRREPGGFRSSCDPSHCDVHRASDTGMSRMGISRRGNRNSLGTNMDTSRAPLDNHSHRTGESRSIPPRGSHSCRDTAPPPAAVPLRLQAQRWRDPPR